MNKKYTGGLLILLAGVILMFVFFKNSDRGQQPLIFSQNATLNALWNTYKTEYIEQGTFRTLDKQRNNITTSEGQSYTMLRAVWMDDQETFDKSWDWTKNSLGRRDDSLFSWLFGQRADGSYGILTDQGGNNSASDADTDIAVALLFANKRWQNAKYLDEAKNIINDIWEKDLVTVNGRPVVAVSETERLSAADTIIVNPSYFAPYAYRMFAEVDPGHNWGAVIDTSYEILQASMDSKLDKASAVGLPPDWIRVSKKTGEVLAPESANLTSNYGYDAIRTSWRLALDWEWYQEARAKQTLERMNLLKQQWESQGSLAAVYSHDGSRAAEFESPAMYGGSIGYFKVVSAEVGRSLYDNKLKSLYDPNSQQWVDQLGYYEDNWAWFGIALWEQSLPNLFQ